MQLKAIHMIVLGLVSWNIFTVQTRLADDRIVFPNDNDESTNALDNTTVVNNITLVGDRTLAVNSTIVEELDQKSSSVTTTELPTLDNRFLLDSVIKCAQGHVLRGGRCRKRA